MTGGVHVSVSNGPVCVCVWFSRLLSFVILEKVNERETFGN